MIQYSCAIAQFNDDAARWIFFFSSVLIVLCQFHLCICFLILVIVFLSCYMVVVIDDIMMFNKVTDVKASRVIPLSHPSTPLNPSCNKQINLKCARGLFDFFCFWRLRLDVTKCELRIHPRENVTGKTKNK
jgi:hypothetical protein